MKRISRFFPPAAVGRERAEHHYSTVHHPFARRLLRDHGDRVLSYATNRADLQYSLSGRLEEEPTAWRFVILEVDDQLPDATGYLPPWVQPLLWTDHAKCIERMDAWEVEARTLVDRRCGQNTSAKYLFLYGAGRPEEAEARRLRYLTEHVPRLAALMSAAFGARLYTSNRVLREAETSDDFGSGASYTGGYRSEAALIAIDELYFDNVEWAADLLGSAEAVALLRDSVLGRLEGYQVHEVLGVDKREPLSPAT